MDFLREFNKVMTNTGHIALATAHDNTPNVRVVSFVYDTEQAGAVYIITFRNSPKTRELFTNDKVALTTIPQNNQSVVRIRHATAQKSALSVTDMRNNFVNKYPVFDMMITDYGNDMEIWEIRFKKAEVIVDTDVEGIITF